MKDLVIMKFGYIKLFIINFILGGVYSTLYYLFLHVFHVQFLTTVLIINTIGSLQACVWYYLGVHKEKTETDSSYLASTRFNILNNKRGN